MVERVPTPWPEIELATTGPDATVLDVVRAGLTNGTKLLVDNDPIVRQDIDIEGVHQARVGIRRTRSILRLFAPHLDPDWALPLNSELRALGALLGAVRDNDVMYVRLARGVERLPDPDDRMAGYELLSLLREEHRKPFRGVVTELRSTHYHQLVLALVAGAEGPVFGDRGAPQAEAAVALPALVAGPWQKLHREIRRLPHHSEPSVRQLHAVRLRAKRARRRVRRGGAGDRSAGRRAVGRARHAAGATR